MDLKIIQNNKLKMIFLLFILCSALYCVYGYMLGGFEVMEKIAGILCAVAAATLLANAVCKKKDYVYFIFGAGMIAAIYVIGVVIGTIGLGTFYYLGIQVA